MKGPKARPGCSINLSAYGHLMSEIKHHLTLLQLTPVKLVRDKNRIVDNLANIGRFGGNTACRLASPMASLKFGYLKNNFKLDKALRVIAGISYNIFEEI